MALRIIRKSSSQSQVELIRGESDKTAEASLLFFLESDEQLALAQSMIKESEWIQTKVQCLFMKGQQLNASLRSSFSPMGQTIKLLNEPPNASWSLRLRTLVQEADNDICLFMPFIPETDPTDALPALISSFSADPAVGMAGFTLSDGQNVLAAGQDYPSSLATHSLELDGEQWHYEFDSEKLFYLYSSLPLGVWQRLGPNPFLVSGIPLPVSALSKAAYLSLNWSDQPWSLPWLAQEIALGLRQKQYRLQILPQTINLSASESSWLDGASPPEGFKEKFAPGLRQLIFSLYQSHGWRQNEHVFHRSESPLQARIESYYAEKVARS